MQETDSIKKQEESFDFKPAKDNIELTSAESLSKTRLTKEQKEIIAYAQADPQKFADELTKRIIEKSNLNPNNKIEKESANIIAKIFTLKALEVDQKRKKSPLIHLLLKFWLYSQTQKILFLNLLYQILKQESK